MVTLITPGSGESEEGLGHNVGVQQTPEKLDRLVELRKQGFTLDEIGKQIGISGERVRQIARSLDPECKTLHALSKLYGVGMGRLQRLLDEHEIRPEGYRGRQLRAVYSVDKISEVVEALQTTKRRRRRKKSEMS